MSEETLFAFERDMATAEVAECLRIVADRLKSGEDFTLDSGTESVTLVPPRRIKFNRIAAEIGIRRHTVEEYLRRAEHKPLGSVIDFLS